MRLILIILITIGLHPFSFGQEKIDEEFPEADCDSIVLYPEEEAQITNYSSKLELVRELLLPIFEEHITESSFISKYYFICTVDEKGRVINVEINKGIQLSTKLKAELKNAFVEHTEWTAGRIDQKPCCSKILFIVNVDLL